jgi:hypothetical protein
MDDILNETAENTVGDTGPVELTELFVSKRKAVTLSDIITVQAIICVIISIAYVTANTVCPDVTKELYSEFTLHYSADTSDGILKEISEFLNSKPVRYD